jgi:hypothetical protein
MSNLTQFWVCALLRHYATQINFGSRAPRKPDWSPSTDITVDKNAVPIPMPERIGLAAGSAKFRFLFARLWMPGCTLLCHNVNAN